MYFCVFSYRFEFLKNVRSSMLKDASHLISSHLISSHLISSCRHCLKRKLNIGLRPKLWFPPSTSRFYSNGFEISEQRKEKQKSNIYRTYYKNTDPKVRKGAKRKKVKRGGEREAFFGNWKLWKKDEKKKENTSRQRETLAWRKKRINQTKQRERGRKVKERKRKKERERERNCFWHLISMRRIERVSWAMYKITSFGIQCQVEGTLH